MNLKKILLSLTTILIFGAFVAIQGTAYAATTPRYMGIIREMEHNEPHMGYSIGETNQTNAATIWNIVKYNGSTVDSGYENGNYYCLKSGVGFTTGTGTGDFDPKLYNISYDMKKDRETIRKEGNEILKGLENGTIDGVNRYDAILSVLDNSYLPGKSTENDKKQLIYDILQYAAVQNPTKYSNYTIITEAFNLPENMDTLDFIEENNPTKYNLTDYALTDNDIRAVQQAVLWYFTNYDTNDSTTNKFNRTEETTWLNYYDTVGKQYAPLANYVLDFTEEGNQSGAGNARNYQAVVLYNYMIEQAKKNVNSNANITSNLGAPVTVETTTLNGEIVNDNYIIGPIHMKQSNTSPYTIDFIVKNNGNEISNYQLLDENKAKLPEGTTVKSQVGKNFYISIPKSEVESLTIDIKVNYSNTTMTIWASSSNNLEQPLVEVEKNPDNESKQLQFKPEKPDEPEPEESFDLKLIKRITAVNDQNVPERIEKIDVSKLNISSADSKTTAEYTLNKEKVGVAKGDIVTYTFRIYNEGTLDGYAQEITEDVPEGLEFIWDENIKVKEDGSLDFSNVTKQFTEEEKEAMEFNLDYLWGKFVYDDAKEKITQISSDFLAKENETTKDGNLIKAFGHNDGSKTEKDLSYKELSVKFKVVSENVAGTVIRNEAAITEDCDKDGNPVKDRDSDTEKWVKYEDDEDYDNIILQSFDLALRKFIIAISDDTKIENNEYLKNQDGSYTRAPIVDTSKLNTKDKNGKLITTATYNHTKEPIIVKPNDIVVYMLRVYNEGDVDGYAAEIKDHLPPYLEYVDDEFNKQYGWKVSEDGRTVTTEYLKDEKFLINKAQDTNGKIVLSYQEVPIMCKVKENAKTSENITNIADITKYLDKDKKPAVDRDSQENNVKLPADKDLPNYKEKEKGSYVPGQQDDDDFEKVLIKTFDLALRKWVTQAIVIENGKQSVTQTGHDAWDDPEQVVKVELHRKKLNQVTVKFRYSIRVYNQGEIEGYAKEITDYIPEGLKFVAEDNPGWTDEGNNVISTRLLENTLLQPGEYADVQVLLTWINNENNMGVMNNTAEISEDYNEYGVPDIDSTPDNKKAGEDDIDDAPVMLSISTGQIRIYFTLGFIVLITTASGVILIKKFVL